MTKALILPPKQLVSLLAEIFVELGKELKQAGYVERVETGFDRLTAIHGLSVGDVTDVFLKTGARGKLSSREREAWKKVSHPTFLGIQPDLTTWLTTRGTPDGNARDTAVAESRSVAFAIATRLESVEIKPQFLITPITVFDILAPDRQASDPILFAWSQKILRGPREISLVEAWEYAEHGRNKLYGAELVPSVLTLIEKNDLPIFSLEQLAERAGLSAARIIGKSPRQQLLELLTTETGRQKLWRREKSPREFAPSPPLNGLARALGVMPEDLVVSPKAEVPAAEPAQVESAEQTLAEIPKMIAQIEEGAPISLPVKLPEKKYVYSFYQEELIDRAIAFGAARPRGEDEDYLMRSMFMRALEKPSDIFDNHGLPSLPHLWLMWTAFPETQKLTPSQILQELPRRWNVQEYAE